MLVITVLKGERVRIRVGDETIWVRVAGLKLGRAQLGFEAEPSVQILREELLQKVRDRHERKGAEKTE